MIFQIEKDLFFQIPDTPDQVRSVTGEQFQPDFVRPDRRTETADQVERPGVAHPVQGDNDRSISHNEIEIAHYPPPGPPHSTPP